MERDEDVPEWEKSKENVQPRKSGRSVGKLNAGLSAKTDIDISSKLKLEKDAYEAALRSYEGDDPLSVWYNYINWTEENFPSGGKTTQLQELLCSCIKELEQSDKYKNDERFVQIWITFAGKCREPCEVYKHMHSKGIGKQSAIFYKTWALAYEEQGQSKMADKIFVNGITSGAQPVDALKRAREEFETRTCRILMKNMTTSDDPPEDESVAQRQTLAPLAKSSKGSVPFDRASAARPKMAVTHGSSRAAPQKPLAIFADENNTEQPLHSQSLQRAVLPDSKENTLAAGKWTSSGKGSSSSTRSQPAVPQSMEADFDVHHDPAPAKVVAHTTTVGPGLGLSVKKPDKKGAAGEAAGPIYIFTSSEPSDIIQEVPMYAKTKVYAGVSEYSFEELRAIKWQQEQDKKKVEQDAVDSQQKQKDYLNSEIERQLVRLQHEMSQEQLRFREQLGAEMRDELRRSLQALRTEFGEIILAEREEANKTQKLLESRIEALEILMGKVMVEKEDEPVSSNQQTLTEQQDSQNSMASCKTPMDKSNSSIPAASVSFKRHRTPDSSCAKKSLIKNSSFTQDCANLMNGFFNQTLLMGGGPPVTHNQSSHTQEDVLTGGGPSVTHNQSRHTQKDVLTGGGPSVTHNQSRHTQENIPDVQSAGQFHIYTDSSEHQTAFPVFRDEPQSMSHDTGADKENAAQPSAQSNLCATEQFAQASTRQPFAAKVLPTQPVAQNKLPAENVDPSGPLPTGEQFVNSTFSAFKRPLNFAAKKTASDKPAASSFAVFDDEQVNVPQPPEDNCRSRLMSEAESMDSQTDMEIRCKFTQHARAISTPFNAGTNTQITDIDVSEIKETRSKLVHLRSSAAGLDFAATQNLSPICEQSRESVSSSSRSVASSDGSGQMCLTGYTCANSNMFMTKMIADTTKAPAHTISMENAYDSLPEHFVLPTKSKAGSDLDVVREESGELLQGVAPVIDTTFYQPLEMTEAQLNTTVFIDPSNPFSDEIQSKLLRKIDFGSYEHVQISDDPMPKFKVGNKITLDELTAKITNKLGQGGFAAAYSATVVQLRGSLETTIETGRLSSGTSKRGIEENSEVCIKVQKPACPWELYICKELRGRMTCLDSDIERDILTRVMHVSYGAFFSDGSLMVNDLVPFGSLLNLANAAKAYRTKLNEWAIMYITIELLHTVEVLHRCKIIHGDIKPDNILFLGFPAVEKDMPFKCSSIKLIDFGRAIDMSKFPNGTTFTATNETDGFMCIEMKTQQPWTYQTDLFGVVATVYTLLFTTYMKVTFSNNRWQPMSFSVSRKYQSKLWREMFDEFLNIPSCDEIPDVSVWRERFENEFLQHLDAYTTARSTINNTIGLSKK